MLPVLAAERQLAAIEATAFPYMPRDAQRDVLRKHERVLRAGGRAEAADEAQLAAIGIHVKRVPKEGAGDAASAQ